MLTLVIRTKNQLPTLKALFKALEKQTYQDYKTIVVDTQSSDGTYEFAQKAANKVITIKDSEFSHAKSLNMAILEVDTPLIYFTNGHSLPVHRSMLEEIVNRFNSDKALSGIWGKTIAFEDKQKSNFIELLGNRVLERIYPKKFKVFTKYKPGIGMLQNQSSATRTELIKKYKFQEMKTNGGEDALYALTLFKHGHKIAYSPLLDVYHSHGGSNLKALWVQIKYKLMDFEARFKANRIRV